MSMNRRRQEEKKQSQLARREASTQDAVVDESFTRLVVNTKIHVDIYAAGANKTRRDYRPFKEMAPSLIIRRDATEGPGTAVRVFGIKMVAAEFKVSDYSYYMETSEMKTPPLPHTNTTIWIESEGPLAVQVVANGPFVDLTEKVWADLNPVGTDELTVGC
jgi:hypothetical protein